MITPALPSNVATQTGPASTAPDAPVSKERLELRKAAEGFEAIMVRKMLESARAGSFAEETALTGGGMKQFQKMQDENFAEIASQTGTLGFARSIEEQLAQFIGGKP